jgi:hypothetical protein
MIGRRRRTEVALALVLLAGAAQAQPAESEASDAEKKQAQSLFEDARGLMQANRATDACPKLEESFRLYPASGTLLNLALCHEQIGKYASAYTELNESLARAQREHRQDREESVKSHLQAVSPKVSRLTVTLAAGAEVDGLAVTLDGVELRKPSWGVPTIVDPGDHVVVAKAPGRVTWTKTANIGASADNKSIVVQPLEKESASAPVSSATAQQAATSNAATSTSPPTPPASAANDGSGRRTLGIVLAGVGGAGLVVGTVFGVVASNEWSSARGDCPGNVCRSVQDRSKYDAVGWHADASTVGFIAGGVALAAGAFFFLTAPSPNAVRVGAVISPNVAGVSVGGSL